VIFEPTIVEGIARLMESHTQAGRSGYGSGSISQFERFLLFGQIYE
jgi:hypothetical protein